MAQPEFAAEQFEALRPLLFSIAYRMLGSVRDAEDLVQEAYLRYQAADHAAIRSPKAFLTTVITRLSIDHLRSAQAQRETYFGAWLPEPLLTDPASEPDSIAALNESLSVAFLVLLEKLNPVERAVFLLREVFDYDYPTIAEVVGKSESACRQAFHRAREAIHHDRLRFRSTPEEHHVVFGRFLQACMQGDLRGLESVLAEDVVSTSDGGGKAIAATRTLTGVKAVSAFFIGLMKRAPADVEYELAPVNGRTSLIVRQGGTVTVVITATVSEGKISAIWAVLNPDKLHGL
ncbi:RNA polymerase sigma-70 factor [Anaerolineae bacterium CFX9]|nr:RNA polymerase sigma-70 factor [Anaerolineae bacterium CFX9]